jgi:ABC-2 type transport system ATP-binding protein
VAQALVHDPQVIIVDEPTVGLDPEERLRFRQLMANLGRNRTIVLSTHIVADLGSSCNDMALIDDGKIVFRGSPSELVEQAHGKVFEVQLATGSGEQALAQYEVVSRSREDGATRIRAVSGGGALPEGARPAENPTLEEGYLAFMAARGRAEAALTEEEEQ